jgi:hypothetical protein
VPAPFIYGRWPQQKTIMTRDILDEIMKGITPFLERQWIQEQATATTTK